MQPRLTLSYLALNLLLWCIAPATAADPVITGAVIDESQVTATIWVDPVNGDDNKDGQTETTAYRTLKKGVDAAFLKRLSGIGCKVWLKPGTYNQTGALAWTGDNTNVHKPIVIEATQPGQAIITMEQALSSGWTKNGSNWEHSWTHDWGTRGNPWANAGAVIGTLGQRAEMIFVNGNLLTQVSGTSNLIAGAFCVDESANKLYVRLASGMSDTTFQGHVSGGRVTSSLLVGASTAGVTFNKVSNLVLRGLRFTRFANDPAYQALRIDGLESLTTQHVLIEDCIFDWNNWDGVKFYKTSNVTVRRCVSNNNGSNGFEGSIRDFIFEDTDICNNNWRGALGDYYGASMAAFKVIPDCFTGRFQGLKIRGNQCAGLWFDNNQGSMVIEDNVIEGQKPVDTGDAAECHAIWLEANNLGAYYIRRNVLANSGNYTADGLKVTGTEYVSIERNSIFGNPNAQLEIDRRARNGWVYSATEWATQSRIARLVKNLTVRDNTIVSTTPYYWHGPASSYKVTYLWRFPRPDSLIGTPTGNTDYFYSDWLKTGFAHSGNREFYPYDKLDKDVLTNDTSTSPTITPPTSLTDTKVQPFREGPDKSNSVSWSKYLGTYVNGSGYGNAGDTTTVHAVPALVTMSVPDASATEGNTGDKAVFRFTRAQPSFTTQSFSTSAALTVNVYFRKNGAKGFATRGTDYDDPGTTVTIPAGSTSADLVINAKSDAVAESSETIEVLLVGGTGYITGTFEPATVSIANTATNVAPAATAQNVTATEDTVKAITLAGTDSDGTIASYAYTQPANGTVSGTAPNITYTPSANYNGSDSFTFTVTDNLGAVSSAATVSLTVTAVNDNPTVSDIASQNTTSGTATSVIVFTISDLETATSSLQLTGSSNNTTLVPNSNIVFGGSGSNRTVTVTPAAGQIGTAIITVQVSDGTGTGNDTFDVAVSSAPQETVIAKINFQPAASPTYTGYLVDSGLTYTDRGNGLIYGWNINLSSTTRDRDNAISADQRYDTLIHLQKQTPAGSWELSVANGTYRVRIVRGDSNATDQINTLSVEGMTMSDPDGTANGTDHWDDDTVDVTVSDGKLTVTTASGASNAKMCFIEITMVLPTESG